jgi:sorbose reductase
MRVSCVQLPNMPRLAPLTLLPPLVQAQDDTSVIDGPHGVFADIVHVNYTSAIWQAGIVGKFFREQGAFPPFLACLLSSSSSLILFSAGSGNFIVTSSGAATSTIRPTNQAVYNSSKAAIRMLARSLAQEFKDFARVNSVSPGVCLPPSLSSDVLLTTLLVQYMGDAQGAPEAEITNALSRQVLNRTGDYRELKGAYLYLASSASTFTTGTDLSVFPLLSSARRC